VDVHPLAIDKKIAIIAILIIVDLNILLIISLFLYCN
jgi:hypothetical protein